MARVSWTESVVRRLIETPKGVERSLRATVRAAPELASSWRHDLPASVVVFLVALPLCLGIALACGAPLFAGVISGMVGGVVVGALSGSQLMVSGPAAGLTAIVVTALASLGSYEAFLAAVVLGGVVQLALGALRAGGLGAYFPSSVIKGMLAAIGLILILKQIPHALGYDEDYEGDESFLQPNSETTFSSLVAAFEHIEPGAVVVSVLGLALYFAWDASPLKKLRLIPVPLVVVLLGVALNAALRSFAPSWTLGGKHLVELPLLSSWADATAVLVHPDFAALKQFETWRVALTLGVVASLETLLSLEATDRLDPYKRLAPPNRELAAQGVGNIVAGLLGGLPVTGVIVRSAANVDGGARTKLSAILHGVLLALAVVAIPGLLAQIPLAALAAILIYTGFKLAHPRQVLQLGRQGATQLLPFLITLGAILFTDLLVGIAIGLTAGLLFILFEHSRQPCFEVVSPPGAVLCRIRLHEHVSFLAKPTLARFLETLAIGSRLEIDATRAKHVHHDVRELIADFRETAVLRKIDLRLVGLDLPPSASAH